MKKLILSLAVVALGFTLTASAADDCKGKAACCDKAKSADQAKAKGKSCDAAKTAQVKKAMDLDEKGGKRLLSSI